MDEPKYYSKSNIFNKKKRTRKLLFFASVVFFSILLALLTFVHFGFKDNEDMIKKQYLILLAEGKYNQAYLLLSQRIKSTIGNQQEFEKLHKNVEDRYDNFGIKEELIRSSIKINGNIVTFRTKTTFIGLSHATEILEGRVYIAVVDGKIDWIYSLGNPETIDMAEESEI